ncbi:MAG: TonB-dependent receptor [Betaproteobacteria bacterium]|nr:TonB-dependent receptor [Betaproteobacteria bacterium]
MKKLKPTPLALLIGLAFASPIIMAQQATDVGKINVEGLPGATDSGLISQEETPKARSSVNRAYLDKLNPSANAFQVIDLLPGVNAFSSDATGLFGGGIRVRGFAGDQMGLTINGAPVNDSGNFAVYPQEYTDSENLCEVFVTQGSTDTDAPHVGASGGNLGMVTCAPKDKFGMRVAVSAGQLNYQRAFVRLDTGKFGPSDAKAFVSYSKTTADKFKGPGAADREHIDVAAEVRPNADVFLSGSVLYNNAINNNIRALTNAQIAQYGRNFDFSSVVPQHLTPVGGTAQLEVSPADGFYKYNVNPFRNYLFTGKAEFKVNKDLTVSAEPYFWYGYGTGGNQLQLLSEGGTGTMATRVKDINGDGDTLDKVLTYGSSVTETNRPGVTFKANYRVENHNINVGYWTERAVHRQTGPRVKFDNAGNPASVWLDNTSAYLLRGDGMPYQARDWKTISTGTSLYAQDSISLMQDQLSLQVGVRNSSIDRDFTNYANAGTFGVGRADLDYQIKRNYSKVLPSFGAKYNLDPEKSVFFNVAENFRAPSNFVLSNLLTGGTVVNGVLTGATLRNPAVGIETSTNFDLGYRLQNKDTTFSGSVFVVNFKDRIAAAWDPVSLSSLDYNVGNVTMKGAEIELGQKLNKNFSVYGSLTYTESLMKQDLKVNATLTEATAGKQMPDTPKILAALALSYKEGPWFGQITAKHTGKAFSTLVNDQSMDAYTLWNLSAGYKLPETAFFKSPEIRLNVDNATNAEYKRISSPSGSSFTTRALPLGTLAGSNPSYNIGAPRFTSVTLRSDF